MPHEKAHNRLSSMKEGNINLRISSVSLSPTLFMCVLKLSPAVFLSPGKIHPNHSIYRPMILSTSLLQSLLFPTSSHSVASSFSLSHTACSIISPPFLLPRGMVTCISLNFSLPSLHLSAPVADSSNPFILSFFFTVLVFYK